MAFFTSIGTALTLGIASGTTAAAIGAAAVAGAAIYGASAMGLFGGDEQAQSAQTQAPSFDAGAETKKAQKAADEEEKRSRVAAAKSKATFTDPVFGAGDPEVASASGGLLGT